MKKFILTIIAVMFVGACIAGATTTIKFYYKDGSASKSYDAADVKRMEFSAAQENYVMKLYTSGTVTETYTTANVDSVKFYESGAMVVHIGESSANHAMNEIDSVVFEIAPADDPETVTIGSQVWMSKNLDVAYYRNGDPIPQVTDPYEWQNLTTGAWCYYANDPDNNETYGKIYNWYAVNDPRGLAPEGWHVASDEEWKTLEMHLGMSQSEADDWQWRGTNEGSKLAGNYELWDSGDLRENSEFGSSGFGAIAGGYRIINGYFYGIGNTGYWWSSTVYGSSNALFRHLSYNYSEVRRYYCNKEHGFPVRCVRNTPRIESISPESGTIGTEVTISGEYFGSTRGSSSVSFNGTAATEYTSWSDTEIVATVPNGATSGPLSVTVGEYTSNTIEFTVESADEYETVTIGSQVWMAKNLDVAYYRNGDPIPQVTDATEWENLTTGAWCYYNNDPDNNETYGKLYNWYAVNDPRGLAPEGWHVASDEEWKTLEMELGMSQSEADNLGWRGTDEGSKLAGNYDLWESGDLRNNSEFGSSGFAALPGGLRYNNGSFYDRCAYWWSSSEYDSSSVWYRYLYDSITNVYRHKDKKVWGCSVRCVRD